MKVVCLGVLYGMAAPTLASQLGIAPCEAVELLQQHRRTYPTFWKWAAASTSAAFSRNRLSSVFGWPVRVTAATKPTQLFNFPMQANGAEMMRLAAIAATEIGIEVCGPIHDAFLIAAPLDRLAADIDRMATTMRRAGAAVAGIPINVEVVEAKWPERMSEPKSLPMFNEISGLLTRVSRPLRVLPTSHPRL